MLRKMVRAFRRKSLLKSTLRANVRVGEGLRVGAGSLIWAPRALRIGRDVRIGSNVRIEVDGSIGDAVLIANSVGIVGKADHDISEVGVEITASRWVGHHPDDLSHKVTIGADVWIGYGAVILSGVTIGNSSVIGAGSVVPNDIPENSIAVGNPARVVGTRFSAEDFDRHWAILASRGVSR